MNQEIILNWKTPSILVKHCIWLFFCELIHALIHLEEQLIFDL